MTQRLTTIDRNTRFLLAVDLRDRVAEDELVRFVMHAAERLPLSAFAVNYKGCGDEQYPPPHDVGVADLLLRQRHF
jgi:hypothetical protein